MRKRAILLAALAAWPASVEAQTNCSVLGQNTFVRNVLQDVYLWYDRLPNLDPALFDSPEAYLEAVRVRPEDESFSYIEPAAVSDAFISDSQFIGIGFSMKPVGENRMRVSQVFPDSPASEAGLARGDYLTAIDGRSIEELLASGQLDAAIGPSEIGVTLELAWRTQFGEERRAVVVKRFVTIPTVSQKEVIDLDGLPVGYLHFRNFVQPSIGALDAAFTEFRERRVTDVILDLRYNGGGLVDVARHLGSLIGGSRTTTQPFVEVVFNDKNTFRNRTYRFDDPQESLDLPRLVVITTRASASSSELVIQGLKPFIPVTVVGDRTFGKPVGQIVLDFCDKVLAPVAFRTRNATGETDYFNGIPANCPAADNLERALGDPAENSLAEALHFLRRGQCSAASQREALALEAERFELPAGMRTGFAGILNAW